MQLINPHGDIPAQVNSLVLIAVAVAAACLVALAVFAFSRSKMQPSSKRLLLTMGAFFTIVMISAPIMGAYYVRSASETGGPIHWKAGIEFWVCGSELMPRAQHGKLFSNQLKSTSHYDRNDKTFSVRGVIMQRSSDTSLARFMRDMGGYMQPDGFALPLEGDEADWFASGDQLDGDSQGAWATDDLQTFIKTDEAGLPIAEFANSQSCDGLPSEVQLFVYRFDETDNTYTQEKIASPADYFINDKEQVPPGDCMILEFDPPKDRTSRLCESYGKRDAQRCSEFGQRFSKPQCNIRENSLQ